jgi:hypothetical protein
MRLAVVSQPLHAFVLGQPGGANLPEELTGGRNNASEAPPGH